MRALENLNIMITGTHWWPLSVSFPSFALFYEQKNEKKTKKSKQCVPYDCLVMELLQWIYYFSLWILPAFFFLSHANALPPITLPPLLFARFCCCFLLFPLSLSSSFFCLMLGRIDLLMVRGIKLGRFATRYDGIFYKQNRIKWKKQKKKTTVWTHSKFCKAYVSVELAVFAWMLNG